MIYFNYFDFILFTFIFISIKLNLHVLRIKKIMYIKKILEICLCLKTLL